MSSGDDLPKNVAYQFTYEELAVLDRAAQELGLRDAEELVREVMHRSAQVRQQEARQPRTPNAPTLNMEPPGLNSVPEGRVDTVSAGRKVGEKVEGKTLGELEKEKPSLATRAFQRARERDRER